MTVLLIGGPLDGELREGDNFCNVANGIARHESLSEDEVARMLKAWRVAWEERHLAQPEETAIQKLQAIADYCTKEAPYSDQYCCAKYLNEIAALAKQGNH